MEARFSVFPKKIRRRLSPSREDPARHLGVGYATVNRRENDPSRPSKPARAQFVVFVERMTEAGGLAPPAEGGRR